MVKPDFFAGFSAGFFDCLLTIFHAVNSANRRTLTGRRFPKPVSVVRPDSVESLFLLTLSGAAHADRSALPETCQRRQT